MSRPREPLAREMRPIAMSITRTLLIVTAIAMAYATSLTWAPTAHALSCGLQPLDPAAVLTTGKPVLASRSLAGENLLREPMYVVDAILLELHDAPAVKGPDGQPITYVSGQPDPRIATMLIVGTSWGELAGSTMPAPAVVTRMEIMSVAANELQAGQRVLLDVRRTAKGWQVGPCAAVQWVTTPLVYPQRRSISQLLGLTSLTTGH